MIHTLFIDCKHAGDIHQCLLFSSCSIVHIIPNQTNVTTKHIAQTRMNAILNDTMCTICKRQQFEARQIIDSVTTA